MTPTLLKIELSFRDGWKVRPEIVTEMKLAYFSFFTKGKRVKNLSGFCHQNEVRQEEGFQIQQRKSSTVAKDSL